MDAEGLKKQLIEEAREKAVEAESELKKTQALEAEEKTLEQEGMDKKDAEELEKTKAEENKQIEQDTPAAPENQEPTISAEDQINDAIPGGGVFDQATAQIVGGSIDRMQSQEQAPPEQEITIDED